MVTGVKTPNLLRAAALALMGAACAADPAAVIEPLSRPSRQIGGDDGTCEYNCGGDTPPGGAAGTPQADSGNAVLRTYSTTVRFDGLVGRGEARMNFFATDATQEMTLAVWKHGTQIASRVFRESTTAYRPLWASSVLRGSIPVGAECDHVLTGATQHSAGLSWRAPGTVSAVQAQSDAPFAEQPPCNQGDGGDGGGGGAGGAGGGGLCWWHVRYDVETGEVLSAEMIAGSEECYQ